jgi:hypothetical protein
MIETLTINNPKQLRFQISDLGYYIFRSAIYSSSLLVRSSNRNPFFVGPIPRGSPHGPHPSDEGPYNNLFFSNPLKNRSKWTPEFNVYCK